MPLYIHISSLYIREVTLNPHVVRFILIVSTHDLDFNILPTCDVLISFVMPL